MHNIALTGLMRSGKDLVGEYLVTKGYHKMAFATGIGEVIEKYYPKDWAKGKPRKHYQHIGQSLRELDENVWVNYVFDNMPEDKPIVITDMRQLNEAEKVREKGFVVVKVVALEHLRMERMEALGDVVNPEDMRHETEVQASKIIPDFILYNNFSPEVLYAQIDALLIHLEREG